eukprot:86831-Pyramimonas_sp.AAC.1
MRARRDYTQAEIAHWLTPLVANSASRMLERCLSSKGGRLGGAGRSVRTAVLRLELTPFSYRRSIFQLGGIRRA